MKLWFLSLFSFLLKLGSFSLVVCSIGLIFATDNKFIAIYAFIILVINSINFWYLINNEKEWYE